MNDQLRVFHDVPNKTYFPTPEIQWILVGEKTILTQKWKSHKNRYSPVWVMVKTIEAGVRDEQPKSIE